MKILSVEPPRFQLPVLATALIVFLFAWMPLRAAMAAEPVLLVGNSFTGATYRQISFRTVFKDRWVGGYNLDDHFKDAATRASICSDRTFVLLQDFSTRAASQSLFQLDMDEMIPLVRSCNAVPVLFMTWETQDIAFAPVKAAYEQAAARHNVQLVPVGLVFNRLRAKSESMYQSFIQPDGKHPTVRGAKVAAASILRAFCNTCFQAFDWSGFSSSEVDMILAVINENITSIVLPPEEEEINVAYLPAILSLLLSD
jgi:hypothetical protein